MIVYGVYRWFPKVMAFRADYCRSCHCETIALRTRTLDVFFLFWIPLIPIGWWQRWNCSHCGNPPHRATQTRRSFKIAGGIVMLLISALFWFVTREEMGPEIGDLDLWALRLVPLLLAAGFLWWARGGRVDMSLRRRLDLVAAFDSSQCPVCGNELYRHGVEVSCSICGIFHRPLARSRGR